MAWSKNGTTTLSSAGDTVTVSSLTATEFNHFMMHGLWTGTTLFPEIRVGNGSVDTGSNYAYRSQADGVTDTTGTSQTSLPQIRSGADLDHFTVGYFINIGTEEKLFIYHTAQTETSVAVAPTRREIVGKWVNTSNQIDTIQSWDNGGTSTFASDSNLTVLNGDTTEETILGNNVQSGSRFEATDTRKIYYGLLPSVTFEDDFSSYANQTAFDVSWVTSNTAKFRGNPSNDNVDILTSNSYDNIYYDLTSVSDTKWLCRFKVTLTTAGSQNLGICYFYIGTTTGDANESQSGLGFYFYDNANYTYALADNGNRPDQTSVTGDLGINPSATTYYAEMKRTSATSFTVTLYSDSSYSTSLGTSTLTINSGITGLRYFKIMGYNTTNGLVGTLDDFKFYNGVTSPTDFTWTEEA